MKTADILKALDVLNRSGDQLRNGGLPICDQVSLGLECFRVAQSLRNYLEREHPECKVEA